MLGSSSINLRFTSPVLRLQPQLHNHTYCTIKILLMIDPAKQEIISRHLAMASVEGGAMVGQIEWLKVDVTRMKVELELLE